MYLFMSILNGFSCLAVQILVLDSIIQGQIHSI